MAEALLIKWYRELPRFRQNDDPDLWGAGLQHCLRAFRGRVRERYTEGTLLRLADSDSPETRRAAVLGLGAVGATASVPALARRLHDVEPAVVAAAADALWEVWFRDGTEEQNLRLEQITQLANREVAINHLNRLVADAPNFAEAFNQRAILYFQAGDFLRSARDCETVLRLNPVHFGAQAGLGQCYLKLGKHRAALRAFRLALEIHPHLSGVAETVRALEEILAEGESRGDYLDG